MEFERDSISVNELSEAKQYQLLQMTIEMLKDGSKQEWQVRHELEKTGVSEFLARKIILDARIRMELGRDDALLPIKPVSPSFVRSPFESAVSSSTINGYAQSNDTAPAFNALDKKQLSKAIR